MPTPLRVPHALARSLGPALLLALVFLLAPQAVFGQHVTGFNIQKSCPITVPPGSNFNCTFSLQNQDTQHGVINLADRKSVV